LSRTKGRSFIRPISYGRSNDSNTFYHLNYMKYDFKCDGCFKVLR